MATTFSSITSFQPQRRFRFITFTEVTNIVAVNSEGITGILTDDVMLIHEIIKKLIQCSNQFEHVQKNGHNYRGGHNENSESDNDDNAEVDTLLAHEYPFNLKMLIKLKFH